MDNYAAYRVLIRLEAQEEIQEAQNWYRSKSQSLGTDFLRALDERFTAIEADPLSYPVIYKQVRRALLRRFPYSLIYMIEDQTVVILACFHASRDPKQWQSRADDSDSEHH